MESAARGVDHGPHSHIRTVREVNVRRQCVGPGVTDLREVHHPEAGMEDGRPMIGQAHQDARDDDRRGYDTVLGSATTGGSVLPVSPTGSNLRG